MKVTARLNIYIDSQGVYEVAVTDNSVYGSELNDALVATVQRAVNGFIASAGLEGI